jgi:hypothetical protein
MVADRYMHWYLSNHNAEREGGREEGRKKEKQNLTKLSQL